MARKRHTAEEIVAKLQQVDVLGAAVRRDAGPTAPGEGHRSSCTRDRHRKPRPGIPLAGSEGLGERSA